LLLFQKKPSNLLLMVYLISLEKLTLETALPE